jgi:hypothetical protein
MKSLTEIIKKHINTLKEESENSITDNGTYMVLQNLTQIKDDIETILSFKFHPEFPKLVTGDHAWAGDHISTSKDDVEEVANFIKGIMEKDHINEASTTLCARGKSAAKSKFKVYPSAYANGYAVQVCKGKIKGLDGKKHCSGTYCKGKK